MGGGGGLWWWMGSEGAAASVVVVGALRWYQVRVRGGVVVVVAPVGATGGGLYPTVPAVSLELQPLVLWPACLTFLFETSV